MRRVRLRSRQFDWQPFWGPSQRKNGSPCQQGGMTMRPRPQQSGPNSGSKLTSWRSELASVSNGSPGPTSKCSTTRFRHSVGGESKAWRTSASSLYSPACIQNHLQPPQRVERLACRRPLPRCDLTASLSWNSSNGRQAITTEERSTCGRQRWVSTSLENASTPLRRPKQNSCRP